MHWAYFIPFILCCAPAIVADNDHSWQCIGGAVSLSAALVFVCLLLHGHL